MCADIVPRRTSLLKLCEQAGAAVRSCALGQPWRSLIQHLQQLAARSCCHPSWCPVVATSLTAAVMVNRHEGPRLPLPSLLRLASDASKWLLAQIKNKSSDNAPQASSTRAETVKAVQSWPGVDSAAAAVLCVLVTHR